MQKLESETKGESGGYVQLFVYRIPKEKHDVMVNLQNKLETIFKKHGVPRSDFFQLSSTDTFEGQTSIAKTVSADQDDEVWVKLVHYRDSRHKDEFVAKIDADPSAGPLFGQVMGLLAKGYTPIQGDFSRLRM